jgi:DNA helicase-2/ATP-dependent DNA helicase PcrA
MSEKSEHVWLEDLNPPQREAAEYGDGQLLILAGAGSGKTRAIVHRIAHLIGARGVEPWNILAVTFTNKAAEEMQNRVARLLGPEAAGIWVSTFHSMGAKILRSHIDKLGYTSDFVIYDDTDQLSLIKKVIKDRGLDIKAVNPKYIRSLIDYSKRMALSDAELEDSGEPGILIHRPVIAEYAKRLRDSNAVDFGDLLLLTYRLFDAFPETLEEYRERFQYIMVDEYQDTNRVQYLIVRQLAGKDGNVCVVGDEDQSIYGWRGADISNILNFEKDYPGARVILLEQNYRSTETVIEAASELISQNSERKPKKLWTDNPEGEKIRFYKASDEKDEAHWVVEEMLRMKSAGRSLDDLAVFYRTHAQSRVIEDELRNLNLPYAVYGGTRFYDRKEIKDVIAYLKLIANPADEVSLLRIINVPARSIGDKTVGAVAAEKQRIGGDWIAGVRECARSGRVRSKSRAGLAGFADLIDGLKNPAEGPVTALVDAVIEKSGYKKMLEDEGTHEAGSRLENLEELINAAAEHEKSDPDPSLRGFLEKVSLATDIDQYDPSSGRLILMTIHSAKGLEFPVVFMVGMEDGLFPHVRSLIQEEEDEDSGAVEEERRLCYVGMTRAKELLIMTWADMRSMRGYSRKTDRSMFLNEVPSRYVHQAGKSALKRPRARTGAGGKKKTKRSVDFGDSEIVYDDDLPAHPLGGSEARPGDRVYHPSYGEGVIRRFEESGEHTRVVVRFRSATKKFLAMTAPLKPLD